eukprot:jgi/Chrzof1/12012/Cz06g18030.t1
MRQFTRDSLVELSATAEPGFASVTKAVTRGSLDVPARRRWHEIDAGVLHVSQLCKVRVRCWNHDGYWKTGIRWDYVELRPVAAQQAGATADQQGNADGGRASASSSSAAPSGSMTDSVPPPVAGFVGALGTLMADVDTACRQQ